MFKNDIFYILENIHVKSDVKSMDWSLLGACRMAFTKINWSSLCLAMTGGSSIHGLITLEKYKIRHENFLPGNADERLLEKDVIHVSTKLHKKRLFKKKKVLLFCSQILVVEDKLTTKSVLFCFSMQ